MFHVGFTKMSCYFAQMRRNVGGTAEALEWGIQEGRREKEAQDTRSTKMTYINKEIRTGSTGNELRA